MLCIVKANSSEQQLIEYLNLSIQVKKSVKSLFQKKSRDKNENEWRYFKPQRLVSVIAARDAVELAVRKNPSI